MFCLFVSACTRPLLFEYLLICVDAMILVQLRIVSLPHKLRYLLFLSHRSVLLLFDRAIPACLWFYWEVVDVVRFFGIVNFQVVLYVLTLPRDPCFSITFIHTYKSRTSLFMPPSFFKPILRFDMLLSLEWLLLVFGFNVLDPFVTQVT